MQVANRVNMRGGQKTIARARRLRTASTDAEQARLASIAVLEQ
jgi:hypothetical protein